MASSRRIRTRKHIPGYVKIPHFVTPKDIERILKIREQFPKRLWSDIIAEVVEQKYNT